MGRSVAKGSPSPLESSSMVGGSAILSTGDYRAFRIPNTEVKTSTLQEFCVIRR